MSLNMRNHYCLSRLGTYPVGIELRPTGETGKPTVFTIPKQINDTVLFSCGLPDLGPARSRTWMLKLKELTPVPGHRWINPNGSLTLRVRAEDSNDIYICTAFIPGSLDRETYVYSISLMGQFCFFYAFMLIVLIRFPWPLLLFVTL